MDMKKTLISLLTAGLFGVMSQGAFAAPELMDKVLAVVNKDVVLASQQEALVQKVKASAQESGQSLPDDVTLRKQALDRLIQESLQLQLADRQGLKISDTQLEQAIQSIAADNKMTLDQLRAQLAREGLTYAQYREEVRREILMNEVRRSQVRRRINISDQEVKQVVDILSKQGQQQTHTISAISRSRCRTTRMPSSSTPPRPRSSAFWRPCRGPTSASWPLPRVTVPRRWKGVTGAG
jgi:peptidyl-prolyl cis-trans isomerase SurA